MSRSHIKAAIQKQAIRSHREAIHQQIQQEAVKQREKEKVTVKPSVQPEIKPAIAPTPKLTRAVQPIEPDFDFDIPIQPRQGMHL